MLSRGRYCEGLGPLRRIVKSGSKRIQHTLTFQGNCKPVVVEPVHVYLLPTYPCPQPPELDVCLGPALAAKFGSGKPNRAELAIGS